MKILDLRVTPIAIADPPLRSAYGLHARYALRTIVEVVSEDGITGAAETHGGERILQDFTRLRDRLIGRDAYNLARLETEIAGACAEFAGTQEVHPDWSQTYVLPGVSRLDVSLRLYGAVEVAALDLIGKATGTAVAELLGGRVRDTVPFSAYLFFKHGGGGGEGADGREDRWGEALTPQAVVDQAHAMIDMYGFGSIKLKAGVLPPGQEIETIERPHAAFHHLPLRIDPNAAWSVETAVTIGTALAGALEYLEDPSRGLEGMAQVRRQLLQRGIDLPLASNVAVTNFAALPEAIRTDAVQVVLGDHHYWGGMRAITQLGRLCATFGLGLSMHSNSHLGLSLLAMTHVAAATPHLTYACDTHYPWQDPRDEILESGRVPIVAGAVRVPTEPGLGVTLDLDALARGKERYERCSVRERDDEEAMRQWVDPRWRRVVPAW
jgi:glucarate dehydratase